MRLIAAISGFVILCACAPAPNPNAGDQHSSEKAPLGHAESASVAFKLGAGDLKVTGGAADLVNGDFTYNIPSWKPVLNYSSSGSESVVTIEQPPSHSGNASHYSWDVKLNDSVPMRLNLNFGAGAGQLNLSSLQLRSLDVKMGVGELAIDLGGRLKQDCNINLEGGVGKLSLRLPESAHIDAELHKGLGSLTVKGMNNEGGHYTHEGTGADLKTIHLRATSGIGEIEVSVE